jgi:hypothetical protein
VGTSNFIGGWAHAPAPSGFLVRPGEGVGGSNRIVITWDDLAIANTWLEVTLQGYDVLGGFNPTTGLPRSDVSYFGHRVGDTFVASPPTVFSTNAGDEIGVRGHYGMGAALENVYDFNRDGLVNSNDTIAARQGVGLLSRINLPWVFPTTAESGGLASALVSALAIPKEKEAGATSVMAAREFAASLRVAPTPSTSTATAVESTKLVLAVSNPVEDNQTVDDELLDVLLAKLA